MLADVSVGVVTSKPEALGILGLRLNDLVD